MRLEEMKCGDRALVVRCMGDKNIVNQLNGIGFVEYAPITLIRKVNGDYILKLFEGRVALASSLGKNILVKVI